jgi:hypothetical protein
MGTVTRTLYVVEDANRVLPLVRSIVKDVVDDFRRLRTTGRERRALEVESGTEGQEAACGRRLEELKDQVCLYSQRIEGYLEELAGLGLEVRDLELGLVDFPTLIEGEPAYLSWQLGEEGVKWWHAVDQGFTDRTPVPEALLAPAPLRD